MRVTDRYNFTRHVKFPVSILLVLVGFYIGLFTNIYMYGQPVTFFICFIPIAGVVLILDTIKKEDTYPRNHKEAQR